MMRVVKCGSWGVLSTAEGSCHDWGAGVATGCVVSDLSS